MGPDACYWSWTGEIISHHQAIFSTRGSNQGSSAREANHRSLSFTQRTVGHAKRALMISSAGARLRCGAVITSKSKRRGSSISLPEKMGWVLNESVGCQERVCA